MFPIPILVRIAKYSCKGDQSFAIVTFSINEFHSFVGFFNHKPPQLSNELSKRLTFRVSVSISKMEIK